MPAPIAQWLRDSPLTQDALISNMEYVLREGVAWRRSPGTAGRQTRRSRGCIAVSSATTPPRRSRLRWEWQYRRNPNNPGQEPEIWIAREGTSIVGQYATMPVQALGRAARRCAGPGAWT